MSNKKIVIAIVVVLLLLGVAYGGIKLARRAMRSQVATQTQSMQPTSTQQETTQQPTSTPSSTASASPTTAMKQKEVTITLTSDGFSPATVTVPVGTKVTWVNKSGEDASLNSDPHPTHTDFPPLNLGRFADGTSVSLLFTAPGTHGYHNHFNASERGTVIVQ